MELTVLRYNNTTIGDNNLVFGTGSITSTGHVTITPDAGDNLRVTTGELRLNSGVVSVADGTGNVPITLTPRGTSGTVLTTGNLTINSGDVATPAGVDLDLAPATRLTTMNGQLNITNNNGAGAIIRLSDQDNSHQVGLKAADGTAANYTLEFPTAAPGAGQVLEWDALANRFVWENNGGGNAAWTRTAGTPGQLTPTTNTDELFLFGRIVMDDNPTTGADTRIEFTPTNRGSAATPAIVLDDTGGNNNNGIYADADNRVQIATSGVERVRFNTGEVIFNAAGANYDFKVQSDGNANMLVVDATEDAVGIGAAIPAGAAEALRVTGASLFTGNMSVDGNVEIQDGHTLGLSDGTQTVSLGVDNPAANYEIRFPNAAATAANQVLRTSNDATPFQLEWAEVEVPLEAYTSITNAWNLDNDKMVQIVVASQTVPTPTNQRSGQTGLLRLNQATAWPVAGGAVHQYAGGAAPNITQYPAIIPYTVVQTGTNANLDDGVIFWGRPTTDIT